MSSSEAPQGKDLLEGPQPQPTLAGQIQIVSEPRVLRMFHVTEQELDSLSEKGAGIHLGLFGVAFGALLVALVTIVTVKLNDRAFAAFVAVAIVSGVLSLYFATMAARNVYYASREKRRIKQRQATP